MAFYSWRWNQECPWDGSEANQLARLLASSPKLDVSTFSRWLYNYGVSEDAPPGERARKFLPRIHDYSITRLDRFRRDPIAKSRTDSKQLAQADRNQAAIARAFGGGTPQTGSNAVRRDISRRDDSHQSRVLEQAPLQLSSGGSDLGIRELDRQRGLFPKAQGHNTPR